MAPTPSPHGDPNTAEAREKLYRALTSASDMDALHDLVATKGIEVLDHPFPYLVVAARNRLRDRMRRADREMPMASLEFPEDHPAPSLWDPLDVAVGNDQLRKTLEVLASMDDRDVLVVWLAAKGSADEEIVRRWDELGFIPHHPSLAAIRKRRERARAELRGQTT